MALEVIQRPEEELFTEENPTIYDTPYYTSRFNAANLPLVYKITNTKFPVNSEDAIEDISSVSNNGGFAQLVLNSATYNFLNKGYVEVTNTNSYNGVWQIIEDIDINNIVINAPFVADESGNVQNYYNNYSTLVKVFAGLPEEDPLNSTKPMTLITDNPITVTPNSDNEAIIDVSALVKSTMSLDNDYDVVDKDLYTAFYIEYSEQYDESDGTTVTTTTETFVEDEIAGCTSGGTEFITNGDFATDLSNWSNLSSGVSWVFDTGAAQVTLDSSNRNSKILSQSGIGTTEGVEYNLTLDYVLGSNNVQITVSVGSIAFQDDLTGTGSVNVNFIAGSLDTINIDYVLKSTPGSPQDLRLDNVSVTNQLVNPCLAYGYAVHGALNPQSKYGGNLGEYVQNFNGGVFANKWLTLFDKPVLFKGNYFDLSTLIPQAVIQSAVQAGGFFLQIIEFDKNKVVIEETNYPITQNLGGGIYRFRLDDKTFNDDTKTFTAQILRIPVNLFTSGDEGTFDTTSDPNGNPPSDWNLEKDSRSIVNFDNTRSFEGAASLSFESRSIFNDDYALSYLLSDTNQDVPYCELLNVNDFNFSNDFVIQIKAINFEAVGGGGRAFFNLRYNGITRLAIRFVAGSSTVGLKWESSAGTQTLAVASTINTLNDITVTFNQSTSVTLDVNGSTDSTTSNADILDASLINSAGIEPEPENNDRGFNGYVKDFIYTENGTILRNIALNQEQGRFAFCTETGINQGELKVWTDEEVKFGGGAWIDTTTI